MPTLRSILVTVLQLLSGNVPGPTRLCEACVKPYGARARLLYAFPEDGPCENCGTTARCSKESQTGWVYSLHHPEHAPGGHSGIETVNEITRWLRQLQETAS